MSKKSSFGILAAVAVIAGIALFATMKAPVAGVNSDVQAEISPASGEEAATTVAMAEKPVETSAASAAPTDVPAPAADMSEAEIAEALKPRTMGDANAPVKIIEFASLSCPHCAHFYQETFPKLKADYIDTGKVFFTYVDYPLNAPALDATVASACMPDDKFFPYVKYLFETQQQWAFEGKHAPFLIQNAKLVGGDGAKVEKCVKSMTLKQAVITRMQADAQKYSINSTPSFVLNEQKLNGVDYETFKTAIEAAIAAKGQ